MIRKVTQGDIERIEVESVHSLSSFIIETDIKLKWEILQTLKSIDKKLDKDYKPLKLKK